MADRVGLGLSDYQFKKFESGSSALVTGVFKEPENAEAALAKLQDRGYGHDDIAVMMSDERRQVLRAGNSTIDIEKGTKAVEGLGAGSAIGGTLGAVLGAIVAAGTTVAIPPLGLVVAGPLAAALAGLGAGSATGGVVGALVGSGMPEYHARYLEEAVKSGGIVVGVSARTEPEAKEIQSELRESGADEVERT